MLIIPAIDLKDGAVVRLVQGKFKKRVYSKDPVKIARLWASQGAKLLHVVDLDGAFSGEPKNLKLAKDIARGVSVPIEFGGGVRSLRAIRNILKSGVARVVLGTKAVEDGVFLSKALAEFKDKIVVGVDAKEGKVMVKGWKKSFNNTDALEFCLFLKALGFNELIYTDTLKDGTLTGPNIKEIKRMLKTVKMKVIASGGVSKMGDLNKLKKLESQGLSGVIIGKALYEGKFTLSEALKFS